MRVTSDISPRSRAVAAVFDRSAQTYDSVGVAWFTPIARRLVQELAPAAGERVLDVGCGRGAVLFALAEVVGASGHVTGIDLSTGMIDALAVDIAQRGLTNVEVTVMDAADPGLTAESFDALTASLVLFFLPDPAAALRAWRELLVSHGRLAVSTFGTQDDAWIAVDDVFTPYLPKQLLDARTSGRSGPFGSDAGVEALLADAGFSDVRTVTATTTAVLRDVDHWVEWSWSHGQRAMWESVPEDRRSDVRAAARDALVQATDENGLISLRQEVRYTMAVKDS